MPLLGAKRPSWKLVQNWGASVGLTFVQGHTRKLLPCGQLQLVAANCL